MRNISLKGFAFVLTIVTFVLITCLTVGCSNNKVNDTKQKQEQQVREEPKEEYKCSRCGAYATKYHETWLCDDCFEEKMADLNEPMENEDENIDGYINGNPNPRENETVSEESLTETVKGVLQKTYSEYQGYHVSCEYNNNNLYINITSDQVNLYGFTEQDKEYVLSQSGLPENANKLADTIKALYTKAGYSVNIHLSYYDTDGRLIYTCNS